jgi:hypothetical protein
MIPSWEAMAFVEDQKYDTYDFDVQAPLQWEQRSDRVIWRGGDFGDNGRRQFVKLAQQYPKYQPQPMRCDAVRAVLPLQSAPYRDHLPIYSFVRAAVLPCCCAAVLPCPCTDCSTRASTTLMRTMQTYTGHCCRPSPLPTSSNTNML